MIWLGLFLIILVSSFVLAYLSMKDYQEIPSILENSLYLIRNPAAFNEALIINLHEELAKVGSSISLERLFKGEKKALVIFGPKKILQRFGDLQLLELEDYTNVSKEHVTSFEMELKNDKSFELTPLTENEQFWLQIILQPEKEENFKAYFRATVFAQDDRRRSKLSGAFKEGMGLLTFLPRPLSSGKIFSLYRQRTVPMLYSSSSKMGASSLVKLTEKL